MVSTNQLLFPDYKPKQSGITGAVSSTLIFIDNKDINKLTKDFIKTGNSRFSDQIERQIGRALGFRGNATDVSGKADFQNFQLTLQPTELEELSPAAQSFVAVLRRTATGDTYDSPNIIESSEEQFGGIGLEAKLSRVVLQQQKEGGFRALGSKGIEQFDRGARRVPSASTGKTIAQRTVGPGSTLELQEGQSDDFSVKGLKARGFENVPQFYVDLLYDNGGLATKLFGSKGAASLRLIRLKSRNVITQVSLRGTKGTIRSFLYLIEGIKPSPSDFSGNWDSSKRTLQWKFTTAFEKKLEVALLKQLGEDSIKALDSPEFGKLIRNSGVGCLILGNKGTINGLDKIRFEGTIDKTRSIPIRSLAKVNVKSIKETKSQRRRDIQTTISSEQLTAAVRRSLFARMPKGPLQGPPLSDEILTNRTGRFVRSVFTQVRGNLIKYYYNPIYEVHQNTSRNPNETIEGSIRNITQRRVGRQFNVLKGF